MTSDYGPNLTHVLGDQFGLPRTTWPPSAPYIAPYLSLIVDALGREEAAALFHAARRAHHQEMQVARTRTYQFGFPAHLAAELDNHQPTLAHTSARQAITAIHHIVTEDPTADLDQLLTCALEACKRSGQRDAAAGDCGKLAASGTPRG